MFSSKKKNIATGVAMFFFCNSEAGIAKNAIPKCNAGLKEVISGSQKGSCKKKFLPRPVFATPVLQLWDIRKGPNKIASHFFFGGNECPRGARFPDFDPTSSYGFFLFPTSVYSLYLGLCIFCFKKYLYLCFTEIVYAYLYV